MYQKVAAPAISYLHITKLETSTERTTKKCWRWLLAWLRLCYLLLLSWFAIWAANNIPTISMARGFAFNISTSLKSEFSPLTPPKTQVLMPSGQGSLSEGSTESNFKMHTAKILEAAFVRRITDALGYGNVFCNVKPKRRH